MSEASLYDRLGGYDAITIFVNNLLLRLQGDPQLGRFWLNRGSDGMQREKQLLIDYIATSAGGPVYYTGRDMRLAHTGMNINQADWAIFLNHAGDTLDTLKIAQQECDDIKAFVISLKGDIVE